MSLAFWTALIDFPGESSFHDKGLRCLECGTRLYLICAGDKKTWKKQHYLCNECLKGEKHE